MFALSPLISSSSFQTVHRHCTSSKTRSKTRKCFRLPAVYLHHVEMEQAKVQIASVPDVASETIFSQKWKHAEGSEMKRLVSQSNTVSRGPRDFSRTQERLSRYHVLPAGLAAIAVRCLREELCLHVLAAAHFLLLPPYALSLE